MVILHSSSDTALITVRGSGHPGTFYTSSCPTVTEDEKKSASSCCTVSARATTVTIVLTTTGTAGSGTIKVGVSEHSSGLLSEMATACTVNSTV